MTNAYANNKALIWFESVTYRFGKFNIRWEQE